MIYSEYRNNNTETKITLNNEVSEELQVGVFDQFEIMYSDILKENLSRFKYAVHLMPTHAAGTFSLNCAYYGIPCIGYEGLDTQELCFPHLTVKMGNLNKAKQLADRLKVDKDFYDDCSKTAKTK